MVKSVTLLALLAVALPAGAQPAAPAKRSEAEKKALAKLIQLGASAMELAQNDPHLEVAYHLMDKEITPEALAPLKDLKGVVHLNLRGRAVTDDMLAQLAGLKELTRLHLEKTKITDKGLVHLKGLGNLEYLNLYGTAVTDAGLVHLEGLKKLKSLYLWQTKVTDAGVAKLKKALPQTQIIRGFEEKPKETTSKVEPKKDAKPKGK
jgi:hypothetical protein